MNVILPPQFSHELAMAKPGRACIQKKYADISHHPSFMYLYPSLTESGVWTFLSSLILMCVYTRVKHGIAGLRSFYRSVGRYLATGIQKLPRSLVIAVTYKIISTYLSVFYLSILCGLTFTHQCGSTVPGP